MRDVAGMVELENAAIGGLIAMDEPTKQVRADAASASVYTSPGGTSQPRLQILTIDELGGRKVDMPPWHEPMTFKQTPKAKRSAAKRRNCLDKFSIGEELRGVF